MLIGESRGYTILELCALWIRRVRSDLSSFSSRIACESAVVDRGNRKGDAVQDADAGCDEDDGFTVDQIID